MQDASDVESILAKIPDSSVEKILYSMIPQATTKHETIFANLSLQYQHWKHLFAYKFLVNASPFTSIHIEENVQIHVLKVIIGTIVNMYKESRDYGTFWVDN